MRLVRGVRGAMVRIGVRVALVAPCALALAPRETPAVCTYHVLTSGISQSIPAVAFFEFTQGSAYWSAIAVRSAPSSDWNLEVYRTKAIDPVCIFDTLGSSALTAGVDVVVGDFNHTAIGTFYPRAVAVAGANAAVVEWDDGPNELLVNGAPLERSISSVDVVEIWDVRLEAGVTYHLGAGSFGSVAPTFLLFQNPSNLPYWTGRDGRVHDFADGEFTPSVTDWYGFVLLNENGGTGTVSLQLGTCSPPTVLASGVAVTTSDATSYYEVPQFSNAWSAVGTRPVSAAVDFALETYDGLSGSAWPACFGNLIERSSVGFDGASEFIVADFHHAPVQPYHARSLLVGTPPGSAVTEWDGDGDLLLVNAPPIERATGPADVLEIWDVALVGGVTYTFHLQPSAGVEAKLLLFENPGLAPYWAARDDAVLETSGAMPYLPASDGVRGVVVVNENGASGQYTLEVTSAAVGAEDRGPARTALRRVAPNPITEEGRVEFDLTASGRVTIEVLDVAGRIAARVIDRDFDAGSWTLPWSARESARLAAGVYFLRLRVDGREADRRKIVLAP